MNLHAIVSGAIGAVNPHVTGRVQISLPYARASSASNYKQVPQYRTVDNVTIQMQPVTGRMLEHMDSLNIQGTLKSFHLSGLPAGCVTELVDAVNRNKGKGGDLIFAGGRTWLIVQVIEAWDQSNWCRVIGQLQTDRA